MKLQDQLTSLELSRKLEKLGVKQESLWWWNPGETNEKVWWEIRRRPYNYGTTEPKGVCAVSAFTLSEILELYSEDILIPTNEKNKVDFIAKRVIDKLSA